MRIGGEGIEGKVRVRQRIGSEEGKDKRGREEGEGSGGIRITSCSSLIFLRFSPLRSSYSSSQGFIYMYSRKAAIILPLHSLIIGDGCRDRCHTSATTF